jgi:hypothetical protein
MTDKVTKITDVSHGTYHTILYDDLNIYMICVGTLFHKICGVSVEEWPLISRDNNDGDDNNPDILKRVIWGDEMWCYLFDPQSKVKYCTGNHLHYLGNRLCAECSKGKLMLEVFFDNRASIVGLF